MATKTITSSNWTGKIRITYTASNGTLKITEIEGTKTDSARSWDADMTSISVKVGSVTKTIKLGHYVDFPASGTWKAWSAKDTSWTGITVTNPSISITLPTSLNSSTLSGAKFSSNLTMSFSEYTIKYNANGGSGAPSSQTKTYGKTLTLRSGVPTRTGYTFTKWNTAADGSGTSYSAGGNYTANKSVTLYAQWKANIYSVTYDANGGESAPATQTKTYGVDLKLSTSIPEREGYEFIGWSTTSTGSVSYLAGASYTNNASITLYAVWEVATTASNFYIQSDINIGDSAVISIISTDSTYKHTITTTFNETTTTLATNIGASTSLTFSESIYAPLFPINNSVLSGIINVITYDSAGSLIGSKSKSINLHMQEIIYRANKPTSSIISESPTKIEIQLGLPNFKYNAILKDWKFISNAQYVEVSEDNIVTVEIDDTINETITLTVQAIDSRNFASEKLDIICRVRTKQDNCFMNNVWKPVIPWTFINGQWVRKKMVVYLNDMWLKPIPIILLDGLSFAEAIDNLWMENGTATKIEFLTSIATLPDNYVDVSEKQDGSIVAWESEDGTTIYIAPAQANNVICANENSSYMFSEEQYSSFGFIEELDVTNLDASNINNMDYMFSYIGTNTDNGTTIVGLENWNTANAISMNTVFADAIINNEINLSNWDVNNVESHINFANIDSNSTGTIIEPNWVIRTIEAVGLLTSEGDVLYSKDNEKLLGMEE